MPQRSAALDMDLPDRVAEALDGESVATTVELGGEDAVYVTPSRTLVYRGEGLLSDASVTTIDHEVERVELSEGRRKATITFEHAVDGRTELTIPSNSVDAVIEPVLAAILATTGVTDSGETVAATHRFSELTLVVTSEQLLRQIGSEVWGPDYDSLAWESVTGLGLEEGSVAAQLVLEMRDRSHRTKVPSASARSVYRDVEDALCAAHGVDDYAEFEALIAAEATDDDDEESTESASDSETLTDPSVTDDVTDGELDPIGGTTTEDDSDGATVTEASLMTEMEPENEPKESQTSSAEDGQRVADRDAIIERLATLEAAIERQADLIEEQQNTLAELRDTLNRDQ